MSPPELATSVTLHSIYRDHHGWLIGFLRRKLGNIDHAADLAQDTFERIVRAPVEALLPEPRAYLTMVAKRLAISHFRARRSSVSTWKNWRCVRRAMPSPGRTVRVDVTARF